MYSLGAWLQAFTSSNSAELLSMWTSKRSRFSRDSPSKRELARGLPELVSGRLTFPGSNAARQESAESKESYPTRLWRSIRAASSSEKTGQESRRRCVVKTSSLRRNSDLNSGAAASHRVPKSTNQLHVPRCRKAACPRPHAAVAAVRCGSHQACSGCPPPSASEEATKRRHHHGWCPSPATSRPAPSPRPSRP